MTPFDVLESYIFREINPQTQTIDEKTVTLQGGKMFGCTYLLNTQ